METMLETRDVQTHLTLAEDPLVIVLKRINDLSERIQQTRKALHEA